MQLCDIRTDGGTQPRAQLDLATISEYTEQMAAGVVFPPITVFYDGTDYWLADGFHRFSAATCAGLKEIATDLRQGTLQDAQWYSYSVNQAHGLRRSNEDKRRAVEAALKHEYAQKYTDVQIAKHCGVSSHTVGNYRKTIIEIFNDAPRLVTRNGQAYQMNIANIGRKTERVLPSGETLFDSAMRHAEERAALGETPSADEWEQMPDEYLGDCFKQCYAPRVMIKGHVAEYGAYGVYVCTGCDYAFPPGCNPPEISLSNQRADPENDTLDPPMELEQVADQFPDELTATDRELLAEEEAELDSNEWYTPVEFIEAARTVMGSIDTDPASNDTAQGFIRAGTHYTKETNGLAQEWGPNVWLNPPYDNPLPWVEKLLAEFEARNTKQAILLVNTANSPQWSRLLWQSNFVVCLLARRVRFWRPDRTEAKGTAQDQMIWYIGYETDAFREAFERYGAIR